MHCIIIPRLLLFHVLCPSDRVLSLSCVTMYIIYYQYFNYLHNYYSYIFSLSDFQHNCVCPFSGLIKETISTLFQKHQELCSVSTLNLMENYTYPSILGNKRIKIKNGLSDSFILFKNQKFKYIFYLQSSQTLIK